MIQVTPAAYREIVRLSQRAQLSSPKLQIGSAAGGCLGRVYTLEFKDPEGKGLESEADSHPRAPGARDTQRLDCLLLESPDQARPLSLDELYLSASSDFSPQIQNLVLDYSEDLMGGNFRFVNPAVETACSCGQSFAISSETT